jgi:hypothetical protein
MRGELGSASETRCLVSAFAFVKAGIEGLDFSATFLGAGVLVNKDVLARELSPASIWS